MTELKIKAPFFNYFISQRNHKGELVSVSMSLMRGASKERSYLSSNINDTTKNGVGSRVSSGQYRVPSS